MSFTINLQQQSLKSLHLPLNNFINSQFPRLLNSSSSSSSCKSIDAETFFTSLLQKSTRGTHLPQILNQLHARGLQRNGFIITKFISRSFELDQIDHARHVFDEFPQRHVFLWNAVIRGYSMHRMFQRVVEMYSRMQREFVRADAFTFPYILKACGELPAVAFGRGIHGQIVRIGLENDAFLRNGLLSFYVKGGESASARLVFDSLECKDVVSWTLIVSGFVQSAQPIEALVIFKKMRGSGVNPDWISSISALKAYSDLEDLDQGRCLHGLVIRMGYEVEPDLRVALTSLYAKCGEARAARSLFDETVAEDVMLWNSIISGFAKSGHAAEALGLFKRMLMCGDVQPDSVTIQSSVLACAHVGSLEQARWMEEYVSDGRYRDDVVIRTALIDMFAKCGSVEMARRVFDQTAEKDVFVWSAMITSYGVNGLGRDALALFDEMRRVGVRPNEVTFVGLITACSHSGLVDEGWEVFDSMRGYGVEPGQKHYAGVVDMLGRAGDLGRACRFIREMPVEPGASVWGALLSACEMHRDVGLGERAAGRLLAMEGFDTGHYVVLSNLYASAGLWDGVARVREVMKSRGVGKDSGRSVVEMSGDRASILE